MDSAKNVTRLERNPDQTRTRILEAAFMEIYRNGFQGMRLDVVLAATDLTKGALYHHFHNKRALGYAVVDEVIIPTVKSLWLQPLKNAADPLATLITVIEQMPDNKPFPEMIQYGCPLNNLAQEMSPLDEGFRQRLDYAFCVWHDGTQDALERAKLKGSIRAEVNCDEAATFIMAALEGCIGLAKNAQSVERLHVCNRGLIQFINSLKP
ncbi:MAG TPA: TetR/AcrR family transcriptional regulator [Gammaproteobacteria bacterium]|nr:TetR/AcrR family transcriptional regulator [Gammaproteobacteria bacterium]